MNPGSILDFQKALMAVGSLTKAQQELAESGRAVTAAMRRLAASFTQAAPRLRKQK